MQRQMFAQWQENKPAAQLFFWRGEISRNAIPRDWARSQKLSPATQGVYGDITTLKEAEKGHMSMAEGILRLPPS